MIQKKLVVKEQMVRLSPEEQEVYYTSRWYQGLAMARRARLVVRGIITAPSADWQPPKVATRQ